MHNRRHRERGDLSIMTRSTLSIACWPSNRIPTLRLCPCRPIFVPSGPFPVLSHADISHHPPHASPSQAIPPRAALSKSIHHTNHTTPHNPIPPLFPPRPPSPTTLAMSPSSALIKHLRIEIFATHHALTARAYRTGEHIVKALHLSRETSTHTVRAFPPAPRSQARARG